MIPNLCNLFLYPKMPVCKAQLPHLLVPRAMKTDEWERSGSHTSIRHINRNPTHSSSPEGINKHLSHFLPSYRCPTGFVNIKCHFWTNYGSWLGVGWLISQESTVLFLPSHVPREKRPTEAGAEDQLGCHN